MGLWNVHQGLVMHMKECVCILVSPWHTVLDVCLSMFLKPRAFSLVNLSLLLWKLRTRALHAYIPYVLWWEVGIKAHTHTHTHTEATLISRGYIEEASQSCQAMELFCIGHSLFLPPHLFSFFGTGRNVRRERGGKGGRRDRGWRRGSLLVFCFPLVV